ncbi:CHAT domain-containing protein [Ephemerocybe angulata]|uniref:CHAT domain-containing protein n=1 Tax=Ephemerocybe angulata TaxID=980116 RepID=A0A8H6HUZ2_9AGAR|nr:CHAT domain-containing protein [Tulosesus angulatus]
MVGERGIYRVRVGVVTQLNERGIELLRAFERTGNLSDMTEGILMLQQAVDITPDGHASKPGLLNNLGASLTHRFERTGQLSDIVGAISVQQQAVARTPHGHADLPGYLSNLGNSFTCRFLCTGELSDITDAISVHQQAVGLAPHGHADMHTLLTNLGSAFAYRFERTGQPSDISDAISMLQKAVDLTPQGHIDMPARLSNLGTSFTHRFQHTGELVDITNAISVQQKAMDLMPLGHPHLPALLANLGTAFARRFERTGELSDINDAISVQQEAVNLTPEGHADLPVRLNGLGNSFACRFRRTGEPSDIAEAISVHQKGVDLTPRGHAGLPARLANLGNSFTYRFQRTGELKDIADAISVQQKAVDLTPLGHADLPGYLDNLGSSFTHRFQRTGELVDIANAISAKQKAVDLTPHRHRNMPSLLTNLGSAFACRFHRTGELSDIDDAISMQQKAVDSTPQGHAGLPGYLSSLGSSFNYRFDRTGELSDITEAISVQQKAVDLTPHGHADLPARLGNLGSSFICRFEHTGRLSDVSNSISMQQKAVHLTPDGHADLPNLLTNLGSSRKRRLSLLTVMLTGLAISTTSEHHSTPWFASTGHSGDLEESLSHYKAAAISTIGPPRVKLNAAKHWAHKLIQHCPQSPDVILSFDTVLGLVALIAGLEQTVRGRYTQLETTSGLALEAAAAACALGRADKALEWLEQGRCLVWSQLNNLRTPLDDLRVHNEELARDIADVSKQLENAGSSRIQSHADMQLSEKISLEDEARAHLGLARKWDDLLKRARAIPTFESFLMPSPCSALMQHVPESGPIIVINIDQRRCDALALLAGLDEPLHIPLPNFSIKKANEHRAALTSQLRTFQLRAREVEDTTAVVEEARGIRPATMKERDDGLVHHVLRSLWEEVVKPVLDGLGFSIVDGSTGTVPPRLWWCPTGPLSFLPLHAAGIYQGSDSESALDYVVSSYTPTVTAITDRVKRLQSVDGKASSGLLLTNQPNVPGASPIPGTTKEVRSIFNRAEANGVKALKLEGDEMSIAGCLERMQDFTGIHLACHGSQNAAEPLQSRFLFHQGSLELSTILKSNLKNADLAFLSACQTSTGQEKLSDEAVHLVAGMLAAGYLRVVGTMWSIGDKPAQEVATTFYEYMFTHRDEACGAGFDGTLSAVALHHATRQLHLSLSLDDSERSLLTWIPFVHFGL